MINIFCVIRSVSRKNWLAFAETHCIGVQYTYANSNPNTGESQRSSRNIYLFSHCAQRSNAMEYTHKYHGTIPRLTSRCHHHHRKSNHHDNIVKPLNNEITSGAITKIGGASGARNSCHYCYPFQRYRSFSLSQG